MNYSRLVVDIDEELKHKLKMKALEERTTVKEIVTNLILDYLDETS